VGSIKPSAETLARGVARTFVTCPACGSRSDAGKKFCGDCGAVLADSSSASGRDIESRPAPQTEAERRQLTLMFCDLVGSTALSARLDPEDLRQVIGLYHACIAQIVSRFDGYLALYVGDGALIYFGYPRAHEDDAERAALAGLALIEVVGQLATPERLQIRVGVGTGLVVVGDLIGSGEAQQRFVVGETPNLAARLQAIAEPDTVVIESQTRSLLGNLFALRALGAHNLKGFAEPVQAWQVLGPGGTASRFEAAAAVGAGQGRQRRRCAALGRGRHRQITAHRGALGADRERASHPPAVFLLAVPHRQHALSDHRPDRAGGRLRSE